MRLRAADAAPAGILTTTLPKPGLFFYPYHGKNSGKFTGLRRKTGFAAGSAGESALCFGAGLADAAASTAKALRPDHSSPRPRFGFPGTCAGDIYVGSAGAQNIRKNRKTRREKPAAEPAQNQPPRRPRTGRRTGPKPAAEPSGQSRQISDSAYSAAFPLSLTRPPSTAQ